MLRNPYHSDAGTAPDPRTDQIGAAKAALDQMIVRLDRHPDDRSLLPLSAVVVGVQRGLLALEAYEP